MTRQRRHVRRSKNGKKFLAGRKSKSGFVTAYDVVKSQGRILAEQEYRGYYIIILKAYDDGRVYGLIDNNNSFYGSQNTSKDEALTETKKVVDHRIRQAYFSGEDEDD